MSAVQAQRLQKLARPAFQLKAFLRSISASEIAAICVLLIAALVDTGVYVLWVLPDQARSFQLSRAIGANEEKINVLREQAQNPEEIEAQYVLVRDSLSTFSAVHLRPPVLGRREVLDLLQQVSQKTGVRVTGTVSFQTTEARTTSERTEHVAGQEREVRSYTSLKLQVPLAGKYGQLKSFIAEIERAPQFVVVESIELATREDTAGGPSGELALNLLMSAYFQPEAAVPPPP
jgi:Tfp pilus assembly protein PilO